MSIIPHETPLKQCNRCKQLLPASLQFFYSHPTTQDKLRPDCKECVKAAAQRKKDAARPPEPIIPEGWKQCYTCKQIKEASQKFFYKNPDAKDGWEYQCKICSTAYSKSRYTPKRPPRPVAHPGYKICFVCERELLATPENFHASSITNDGLRYDCRECRSKQERMMRLDPVAKAKEQALNKRWYETHRDRARAKVQRRRARQMAVPGDLTPQQIHYKLKKQKYACYYCFTKFEKRNGRYIYHLDHTIPLARTEAQPRHDMNYTVLACPRCNLSKGDRMVHEWANGGRLL